MFAEVGGKWGMAMLTAYGRPFHEGLHSALYKNTKKWHIIPATLLLIPALMLPLPAQAKIAACAAFVFVSFFMRYMAYRLFGGVNGDITGATGEINRCAVLTVLAIILV